MTDAVKLLSNDEVAEIDARYANRMLIGYLEVAIGHMRGGQETIMLVVQDIPALCATVRALRQQNQELKAIVDIGTSDDPGTALAKVHRIQDEATTALRQQLAQTQQALISAVIPYEALLVDAESRKWIAPSVWKQIESSVAAIREAVKEQP